MKSWKLSSQKPEKLKGQSEAMRGAGFNHSSSPAEQSRPMFPLSFLAGSDRGIETLSAGLSSVVPTPACTRGGGAPLPVMFS